MLIPSSQSRIEIIDILRGFTLLGIIIVHFSEQYYAGAHPKSHANFNVHFLGDEIIMGFIGVLISGKFFMIFSFLFGLSFFLQLSKNDATISFFFRFFWRLVILGVIGFFHHLHYRGDILTIYAMLGVGLLVAYKLPDKLLLIVALVLVINIPSVIVRSIEALQPVAEQESIESKFGGSNEENEIYYATVKKGSYVEVLKANLGEFGFKHKFQVASGRIYITLGLFLLGLYMGRKRVFERWVENLPSFKKFLKQSLWLILGLVIFSVFFFGGAEGLGIKMPEIVVWLVGGFVFDVFNLALAVIYVTGIILLFQKEKWKSRLMNFYEVGRMGLTTYLMQTLFGILIFFGIGFGLLGEIGALASVGIGIALFIVQVYFSKWWLARFRYGIFEWLWRCATYLKWQPFMRSSSLLLKAD
ncbi:MAG: DUF418 domain-containing protein [Cyclobacteriaceae bacterium]|nr:DUF418 domain-containing protein [Cyclobacteriaceae bacterium]